MVVDLEVCRGFVSAFVLVRCHIDQYFITPCMQENTCLLLLLVSSSFALMTAALQMTWTLQVCTKRHVIQHELRMFQRECVL